MRVLPIAICAGIALAPTLALAVPTTFAQIGQITNAPQFSILNTGGITTVSASGQDLFNFLVGGTPFSGPVLADFALNATSNQLGSCGTATCPTGDSDTQQGFTGTFSYTVAVGPFAGRNLLSGTFGISATPFSSGGTLVENVNGTGGSFLATQNGSNPTGIVMASDFLNFAGVSVEAGSWGLSGLSPNFAVNPTSSNVTQPQIGQTYTAAGVGTFSSEPPPSASSVPEPITLSLMGSALVGLGLVGRKRFSR